MRNKTLSDLDMIKSMVNNIRQEESRLSMAGHKHLDEILFYAKRIVKRAIKVSGGRDTIKGVEIEI